MKLPLVGWLVLAALVSCGKKQSPPADKVPPTIAKVVVAPKPASVESVSPAVPLVSPATAPSPEDIAPDEEDPSAPDTDPMAMTPEHGMTPGQHLDRAIEKTGKALHVAGEKAEKGVGVAAEKTEKGLRKATEKTGKALQKIGEAIESKVPVGEPEPAPPGQ